MTDIEYQRNAGSITRIRSIIKNGMINHRKLIIDIIAKPDCLGGDAEYRRVEKWTAKTTETLNMLGYKKGVGFHDNLMWTGIPVFVKFHNLKKFDISARDAAGDFVYPQDTAATLNDWMQSSATDKFIKGMARAKMQGMDLQQIAMIAVLGVGVIIGMHVLGVF